MICRSFAWAYGGMPYFKPYEIFQQDTTNAVMAALLIADVTVPDSPVSDFVTHALTCTYGLTHSLNSPTPQDAQLFTHSLTHSLTHALKMRIGLCKFSDRPAIDIVPVVLYCTVLYCLSCRCMAIAGWYLPPMSAF